MALVDLSPLEARLDRLESMEDLLVEIRDLLKAQAQPDQPILTINGPAGACCSYRAADGRPCWNSDGHDGSHLITPRDGAAR